MTLPDRPPDVMAAYSKKDPASGITIRKSSISDSQPFEFAWENRILIDYINLLVGEEGIGKGTLVAWILAQLTVGKLPGNLLGDPCNVAIIGDEDSYDNVWIPRIKAAGGDTKRVAQLESGPSGAGSDLKKDAHALGKLAASEQIPVFYFDQLLDNLGYSDSWKDQQVRNAFAPLRSVAQKAHLAIIVTLHPNKRRGSFRDMLSGTPAFNAVSRSSMLVAKHPHYPDRRVAVRPKGNYTVEPPAFEFTIEEHGIPKGRRSNRTYIKTSRIADWYDNDGLYATDVLDRQTSRTREDSKASVAKAVLTQMFKGGEPRPASEVLMEAEKLHGIDAKTFSAAAQQLGYSKWQEGFPAMWWWSPNGRPDPDG
jgi:hypothetical protein